MTHRRARGFRALAGALLAALLATAAAAQGVLPLPANRDAVGLEFRPGTRDQVLLQTQDANGNTAEAILLRAAPDGTATVLSRFASPYIGVAFFGADRLLTLTRDGVLETRGLDGGDAKPFARLPPAKEFENAGIAVSPDRRLVAVRLREQPIRLFDAEGKPAGEPIATACTDGECFDEVNTNRLIFAAAGGVLIGTDAGARPIVQRLGGPRLAVAASPDEWHSIGLFVIRMALSPDGRALALGYMGMPGGGADIRDLGETGLGPPRRVPGPVGHAEPANIAGFGPGFVFANADRHRLRFLKSDATPWRADVPIALPKLLAVSESGDRLAVLASEGLVLFDANGERLAPRPFAEFGQPSDVAVLADGKTVAALSHYGTLRLWTPQGTPARTPLQVWGETEGDRTLYGTGLLLAAPDRSTLAVVTPGSKVHWLDATGTPRGAPFALPDPGEDQSYRLASVAVGRNRLALPEANRRHLVQRDAAGAVIGARIGPHPFELVASAYAPDGSRLATYDGATLRLWAADTGERLSERPVERMEGLERDLRLAFAPDGRTVAVFGDDGERSTAHALWHLGAAGRIEARPGHFLRFLPDGAIAARHEDRLVIVVPDGRPRVDTRLPGMDIVAVLDDGANALALENGVAKLVPLNKK